MSFEKEVRSVLGEAAVNYKKLDQLVRQGMMSPAALPILHRGLDKMQAGQVLNPQEREAVNKVMQSMLYIVTGDDTVFQKAKQHTQKTRYQTEDAVEEGETEQLDEYGNYSVGIKGQGGTTVKARSDKEASQKAFKNMGIADRHRKTMSHTVKKVGEDTQTESKEEYDNEGEMAKTQLTTLADAAQELMGMLSDDQNLPEWVQSKITKAVDYLDTARDYIKSEGDNGKAPVGEEVMSESYKEKFAAALKKSGKSLAQMSDEEKKKFFNDVDASHKAKDESVEEGAMSRIDYQQKSGEKGTGLKTFKKKPAPKDTMVASPKTQRVKMTTAKAAKRMVKQGAVYAEEVELLDEGDYAVVSTNGSMITNKSKVHGYVKSMPKGKNLNKLLDKHGADRVIHRDKLKTSNVSEDTVDEASAYADARRAMRADSKGMASLKKSGGTKTHKGTKAGEERHGGHIVMQLRKAVSINKPVKFKDGSEHKVSKADAHKFLSKYNSQKPADREKMHSAHDSHDDFQSHINK
jgi:hypothetical protein